MNTVPRRLLVLFSLALLLPAPNLHAVAIDADVMSVVSAGQWQSDVGQGTYRVVVRQQGFEHVSTGVVAEWVAWADDGESAGRVMASRTLVEPGLLSLGMPRLAVLADRVRVDMVGVDTYASSQRVSCRFELLPDQTIVVVRACG